ncbi:hypothetical protein V7124_04260 [Neobacillus niacini]|uniref:hypothetical protein n=1 Tax=Neobacillus niacini TaxID=86668 RepID=UPI0030008618
MKFTKLLVICVAIFLITGCSSKTNEETKEPEQADVEDVELEIMEDEVEVEEEVPEPLQMASNLVLQYGGEGYAAESESIANDKIFKVGDFIYVYQNLKDKILVSIGKGGQWLIKDKELNIVIDNPYETQTINGNLIKQKGIIYVIDTNGEIVKEVAITKPGSYFEVNSSKGYGFLVSEKDEKFIFLPESDEKINLTGEINYDNGYYDADRNKYFSTAGTSREFGGIDTITGDPIFDENGQVINFDDNYIYNFTVDSDGNVYYIEETGNRDNVTLVKTDNNLNELARVRIETYGISGFSASDLVPFATDDHIEIYFINKYKNQPSIQMATINK